MLTTGNILKKEFIESFAKGALIRWQTELLNRIIPEYHKEICLMKKLHDDDNHTTHDAAMWEKSPQCAIPWLKTLPSSRACLP